MRTIKCQLLPLIKERAGARKVNYAIAGRHAGYLIILIVLFEIVIHCFILFMYAEQCGHQYKLMRSAIRAHDGTGIVLYVRTSAYAAPRTDNRTSRHNHNHDM